jgi:hypothetical protein
MHPYKLVYIMSQCKYNSILSHRKHAGIGKCKVYLLCENAVWWLVMTKASRAESISSHSRRPVALLLPLPERERERERERMTQYTYMIHASTIHTRIESTEADIPWEKNLTPDGGATPTLVNNCRQGKHQ